MRVFLIGYPGEMGGANTEAWHTVKLWVEYGVDVHLIPTWARDEAWRTRVDALAVCSIGGAIDSVLDLKVRTKELKDLFDPDFAHQQTCALCDVCGRELGITSHHIAKSQVLHGSLMSPTWQKAVKRIEQRGKRKEESA